jgi:hypothetical protein
MLIQPSFCRRVVVGHGGVIVAEGSSVVVGEAPSTGACNLPYIYIKKVKRGSKLYYYLVIEEYLGNGKRRAIAHISLKKILESYMKGDGKNFPWCGGWDLNPRRPTPSGPKPDPFGQARAPPHQESGFTRRG